MAKLVDALALGASGSNSMEVQVLSPAHALCVRDLKGGAMSFIVLVEMNGLVVKW